MTQRSRHIETAGKWRETDEGTLYAAVAKSEGETLAKADFTLMTAAGGSAGEAEEVLPELPEPTRREIEENVDKLVRQQAVRVLDRRSGASAD